MTWQFSLPAIAQICAAAVSAGVAYLAWLRRSSAGGRWLALFMLAVAEWALFEGFQAAAVGIPAKVLLSKVQYPGLVSSAPLMLMFVLAFAGLGRLLTRRRLVLLWSVPLVTLLLAASNEWHGLIWSDFVPVPGSNLIVYVHGAWFWLEVCYYYLSVLAGVACLVWAVLRMADPYRRQAAVMLLGVPVPWLGNVMYVFGIGPGPGVDLTPMSFALTGVILTWGMYRLQLFDLVPVARHTLVESMQDGVLVLDTRDRIVDINPAARHLIGADARSSIGRPADEVLAAWPRLLALCHETEQVEDEIGLEGDASRWVDVCVSPLRDRSDRLTGRLMLLRDVTARRNAEREVRRLKEMHESIVQNMSEGVSIEDAQGCFAFVNAAAAAMLGYTPDELLGRHWTTIIPADQHPIVDSANLRRARSLTDQYELELLRKDSERLPVLVAGSPYRDPETGVVAGTLAVFTNITKLKRAEGELRRAKDAAEAANLAKSQFLANMSHEMRTPMNAIIGTTRLLLDTDLAARQRDLAETARGSAEALLATISDILDFSKIESGRLELEHRPFALRQVIEESLDVLSLGGAEKDLELLYSIAPGAPQTMQGDPTRLRQVLINLLSNAVKFTEHGEVTVRADCDARASETPADRIMLHLSVEDSGIGIPRDKMDRLFKPFSQVDASITRRYGGTGLGLVICQRLVDLMGGRISAESAGVPGQGAVFHVFVPMDTVAAAEPPETSDITSALAGRRVLVVDDNDRVRDYLQDMLHAACVEVQVAASGAEALAVLSQNARAFDAVVLDSKMPEQDGVTTASRLRRIDGGATVPLILLAPPGKHKSEAYEALFAAVLNKPIKPDQLMATLRRVLAGAAPPPPTPSPATPETSNLPQLAHALRVLLAEDNLINQKVTVALLARLGCRQGVDVVANGLEALQAVQQRPYDVVLMDVHMPDMDGLAATRAIRERLPPEQRPYIIAITAAAMKGDAEQCLAAGMDAYVSKPVRLEELANVLAGVPLLGAPGAVPDNAATVDPARSSNSL